MHRVPVALCLNRWDLHEAAAREVEAAARDFGVAVVGKVRHDEAFIAAGTAPSTAAPKPDTAAAGDIRRLWRRVSALK
jgi:hypothetical protein